MKILHFLRHAKAEEGNPDHDHARVLSKRGRKAAEAMAAHLAKAKFRVDRVFCSTASRARETLEPLRQTMPGTPVVFREALYMIHTDALLAFLQGLPEGISSVLLIGHNPTFHDLATKLAFRADPAESEALAHLREKFPTGALCSIDCRVSKWSALAPRCGRLIDFLRPKDMDD